MRGGREGGREGGRKGGRKGGRLHGWHVCKERIMVSCFLPGEVWEGRESKEEQHLAGCVQARQPPQGADGSVAHLKKDREGVHNVREERE